MTSPKSWLRSDPFKNSPHLPVFNLFEFLMLSTFVLGMWGIDGREVMRRRFRDDILTLTLPMPLFKRMEKEADDAVFQIPSWKRLVGRRVAH